MSAAAETRSTNDLQGVMQMVDCLYAAACGETPWRHAIARVCEVGKLDGCALSMTDRLEGRPVMLASYGRTCDPVPEEADLWWDVRIMSETLPTGTLFWTDRMQHDGSVSWACVTVDTEERQVGNLKVYARAGSKSRCPELADSLRQLAPHLCRVWRLGMSHRSPLLHGALRSSDAPPGVGREAPTASTGLDGLPAAARLRAEFKLTKAEARLALCLARGWSLATAAEAFDVKLTTIRSQLQQVFSKTGTSRQAEFVAMLLSRGYGSQRPFGDPTKVTQAELAVAG